MLIIICVISAVSILQAVGGLDYLVRVAERILRKKPQAITFVAPILTSVFTLFCGTTYVAFSLYPVIAEVAAEAKYVQNVHYLQRSLQPVWQWLPAL